MPSKKLLVDNVVSQMMKGLAGGKLTASRRQKLAFKARHEKHIEWVVKILPRCSAGVHAVLVKAIIKYGEKPVWQFCHAFRHGLFQGTQDPVLLLWKFLDRYRGKNTTSVYQKSVSAVKAYMEGKPLAHLRPAKDDVFEWDEDWTVPDELLANWDPDRIFDDQTTQAVTEVLHELQQVEEEVDKAMEELRTSD